MLSHNISPIIFSIGNFNISYYLLVYLIGFVAVLLTFLYKIKNKELNISEEQTYSLIFWSLIGVTFGARIFHVIFWNPNYYLASPIEIFYLWQGGLSFHGGLLGAILSISIYAKIKKINLLKLADTIVLPFVFFHALQRISNFINQEIVGTITSVPWCFKFENFSGCRHPVQLYAAAGQFALFFILLKINSKKIKSGFLFWIFVLISALGRFFLDFIREDAKHLFLASGQWFSLLMICISTIVLIKYYKK